MTDPFPYRSPAALRAALTDRLKKLADSSPFAVTELHRQFAYDRLPVWVFSARHGERWVLKGAAALLARLDVARHSKDVDLSWQSTMDLDEAEHAFRVAAERDMGDFFVFEIGVAWRRRWWGTRGVGFRWWQDWAADRSRRSRSTLWRGSR